MDPVGAGPRGARLSRMHAVLAAGPGGVALATDLAALLADPAADSATGRAGHPDLAETGGSGEAEAPAAPTRLVVVASGAEDLTLCGLRFTPDLDALARIPALTDPAGEASAHAAGTGVVGELLREWDALPPWFRPDDLVLARAVVRTRRLAAGATPSEIFAQLTPERAGVRLVPMTDRPVEAHVVVESQDDPEDRFAVHAYSWATSAASEPGMRPVQVSAAGLAEATPAPGVLDAVRSATSVALPLTTPVTGLGVMLGLPGLRDALRGTSARVVGVSPLLLPRRGDEAGTLATLDLQFTSKDVGTLYEDVLDAYLVPAEDVDEVSRRLRRVDVVAAPAEPATLAAAVLAAAEGRSA